MSMNELFKICTCILQTPISLRIIPVSEMESVESVAVRYHCVNMPLRDTPMLQENITPFPLKVLIFTNKISLLQRRGNVMK